ncbi:zinc finger protein 184-like isoform X2 [Diorhabda carinulata]|uniref:zinc finger protein 184-like isoform X2 n=1 Tax=Diorhabda carinulata TaxID=1163345 RepID=UPI0025A1B439|nr:zinc finger protein 184-like isoform X2 [Diorhabda carinulata]
MNILANNTIVHIYKIEENGMATSGMWYEINSTTKEPISMNNFCQVNVSFDPNVLLSNENRLTLNLNKFETNEQIIKCIKFEDMSDSPTASAGKSILNIPTMIRCQNCETNFPTKYQYQRHQCEFNAEKVVLKSDVDSQEVDTENPTKFVCDFCNKEFANKNNFTRHQLSHENSRENMCEHCNKQFISENRLRIHKENHCKKAGDISKFYRSDVAVWKCKKCQEVFSSHLTASYHVTFCVNVEIENEPQITDDSKEVIDNENIEKVLTEVLLQCEFCNRTYADKNTLLTHQKSHTTSRNYECVNCFQVFDSYPTAAQHWMMKCSDYVSLFYLPKLTYCEHCDRTFKSHELLYTHKIKKKHYTSKRHLQATEETNNNNNKVDGQQQQQTVEKSDNNKEILDKLIEDVFETLDVPVININYHSEIGENKENVDQNNTDQIKNGFNTTEKKKKGRKRKWPKNEIDTTKKMNSEIGNGFKYQCERCIEVFVNVEELELHREKEHASNFTCDECGQVLHTAKALMIHSRAHKMLKPYVCETCGRSYSQTSHLWQHMRFHQGIKPFACPHEGCEARYTIRPDLKDHIRKAHTRERPFKCNVCDKCFLTGSVYYQHRLIHTNDRRYACDSGRSQ